MSDAEQKPVRRLLCCICGAACRGRQWSNRDTGWGVCGECIDWQRGKGVSEDEIKDLYGEEGVHFSVAQEKAP